MAKTKKSKVSSMDPTISRRAVGPYVEPPPKTSVTKRKTKSTIGLHPDRIGAVPVTLADAIRSKTKKSAAVAGKVVKELTSKEADAKKIRIFDLMTIASLLSRSKAHGTRVSTHFIPDYKDHTTLLEENMGCPAVRFEIYTPGEDRLEEGEHWLSLRSEEWEFKHIKEALERVIAYRREQEEKIRRRDAVLRKMSQTERELIGHGEWRDPEVAENGTIPESDDQ